MADRDAELLAVCSFLNDVTLDEIMRYGPDEVATGMFEVESSCSEVGSLDEPSVTGTTSDEDVGSDIEPHSLKSPPKRKRKQKTEAARVRQRVYDKKCRHKKKTLNYAFRGVFISVLKNFIVLVQFRLLKTEHETKLFCLAKKNGDDMPSGETARHQVELNHGAVQSIKNTAKDWRRRKNGDTGKRFLKDHAEVIQSLLDNLVELGEQLKVATGGYLANNQTAYTALSRVDDNLKPKRELKCFDGPGAKSSFLILSSGRTMDDTELAAVWDFLNESTIDEIFGAGSTAATNAAGFIKSAYEVSVAALKRDASPSNSSASDKTSVESTSDVDMQATPQISFNVKRPKQRGIPKTQRERQRRYDKKHRLKKTNMRTDAAKTLVAGLKLLDLLLEDRIQRTRRVSATFRLLHLGKDDQKFPDFDRDLQKINHEAKTQLGLNQAATTYIKLWTATWKLSKVEKGKFFLKSYAADIEGYLDRLTALREKLVESTTELESCMTQTPRGVWI